MKQLSLRFGGLLAFVFLLCFSCTDHEPGRQPRVFTVEAVTTPTAPAVSFRLTIEAGDFPITEYGVVYSLKENANDNVFNTTPTVADTKVIFPLPATNGQHTKVENVVPFVEMYYRTYAIVDGGAVIYGDVMVIDKDGGEQQQGGPVIKTLDTELEYKPENFYIFGAKLEQLGAKSIKEIGVVYSLKFTNNPSFHSEPTMTDTKVLLQSSPTTVGDYTTGHNLPVSSFERMYYRSYVVLSDDSILYGDVKEYVWFDFAVLEAQVPVIVNGFFFAKLNATDLGSLPIEEYGVVYSYRNNLNDPLSALPTIADNKLAFDLPLTLGVHSKIFPIAQPLQGNVRSYVKYTNGVIEYGQVVASF